MFCHEYNLSQEELDDIEFLAGTDQEMESKYEEYLDNYIDDVLEIPDHIRIYFNDEAWKRDAKINSSRAEALNRYNGKEIEYKYNNDWFYAYRQ